MAFIEIRDLTFTYPEENNPALEHINMNVEQGEFIALCGCSGCGKTTLLRHLKTVLTPHGNCTGEILFGGSLLQDVPLGKQTAQIGFVLQNPDNQIVTDKVWHELAFGLESLGMDNRAIRLRVAEMSSFFGIQEWFHKNISELSGGQKQLLNLASIMAMQPSVLVLDEPTSQLDPIAAADFLATIQKINRELGTTVVLSEHRLEEVFPMADRVVVMQDAHIIVDDIPACVSNTIRDNDMFAAMPAPIRIYTGVGGKTECPVTVREGRHWLNKEYGGDAEYIKPAVQKSMEQREAAVQLKDVWFRYDKNAPDVLKGLSVTVEKNGLFCIVGGNGTGKTTALSIISGIRKAYRGTARLFGKLVKDYSDQELFSGLLGVLPQNPQCLFVKKTVHLDLLEMLSASGMEKNEREQRVLEMAEKIGIEKLLERHPYDLSGGEQQRAALGKVLLLNPLILLLDEPTKGMDGYFKRTFAHILKDLTTDGVTVVMVSHDIEFCAEYADRCALFFDGGIISEGMPNTFFSGNSFYTTAANRMARHLFPDAITVKDVIERCNRKNCLKNAD